MKCRTCGLENSIGQVECESCGTSMYSATKYSSLFDEHLVADVVDLLEPKQPLVIIYNTLLIEAIELMRSHDTGCALISQEKKIVGIFTEKDLILKIAYPKKNISSLTVDHIMTPDPVVLRHDDNLAIAINKMVIGNFRHIPLIDGKGHVDGIVSAREIVTRLFHIMGNN
tara:strand:- start:130 stop:639 length:510 start_codon:yes stop_codon:yes gene_type:complete